MTINLRRVWILPRNMFRVGPAGSVRKAKRSLRYRKPRSLRTVWTVEDFLDATKQSRAEQYSLDTLYEAMSESNK